MTTLELLQKEGRETILQTRSLDDQYAFVEAFAEKVWNTAIESAVEVARDNRKGTFTDEGGNDCWYVDSLVVSLLALKKV